MRVHKEASEISGVIKDIALLIKQKKLLPFLGAGFSAGEKTGFNRVVPLAGDLKEIFIQEIMKYSSEYIVEDLKNSIFQDVASIYFQNSNKEEIEELLKQYFTSVKINSHEKKAFLDLDWAAIFTLNVDDAIESNSIHTTIAYPFYDLSTKHIKDYQIVFKLHGDIKHNIIHPSQASKQHDFDEVLSIIFCESSYLKSILKESSKSNLSMLNTFLTAYKENNFIFIGCSLYDETDIKAIIALESADIKITLANLKRFYISTKVPSTVDMQTFENKFGITDWIVFNINDIDKLYFEIINELKENGYYDRTETDILPTSSITIMKKNSPENLKVLCGLSKYSSLDITSGLYSLPYFVIDRDKREECLNSIGQYFITIIVGKRITGKSIFVLTILKELSNSKNVYYIPSEIDLDLCSFKDIFDKLPHNSLIAFDSNTISDSHIIALAKAIDILKEKQIRVILVFNASDRLELAFIKQHISNYTSTNIELKDKLTTREVLSLNQKLDESKFPHFKKEENILHNIFRYKNIPSLSSSNILSSEISKGNNDKYKWCEHNYILGSLIIILTTGKMYTSTFNLLYEKLSLIDTLVKNLEPNIEKEFTVSLEKDSFSGYKITANCKACLMEILNDAISNKKIIYDFIASSITEIAKKLNGTGHSKIYKQVILFDNLNQIFGMPSKHSGAGHIIYRVYEALEDALKNETDYWLQRAKSYLHLSKDSESETLEGIKYAEKAFYDFSGNARKEGQSIFVSAMLYGKLARI